MGQDDFLAIYNERVKALEKQHAKEKEQLHAIYVAMMERQKTEMAAVKMQGWRMQITPVGSQEAIVGFKAAPVGSQAAPVGSPFDYLEQVRLIGSRWSEYATELKLQNYVIQIINKNIASTNRRKLKLQRSLIELE